PSQLQSDNCLSGSRRRHNMQLFLAPFQFKLGKFDNFFLVTPERKAKLQCGKRTFFDSGLSKIIHVFWGSSPAILLSLPRKTPLGGAPEEIRQIQSFTLSSFVTQKID